MIATYIPNHVQLALNRLMAQYRDKPRIAAVITSFVQQLQDLEDATFPLDSGRSIFTAVGVQLDLLGTIVDLPRNGLDDDAYRLFLLGRIAENTSDATIDRVIQVYGLLLNSDIVNEQELYPGAVGLMGASPGVDPVLVPIIRSLVQLTLAAGVRLDFLGIFDETDAFAFAGGGGVALGFGDVTDLSVGGKFATLLI